jgi:hypothetical protein
VVIEDNSNIKKSNLHCTDVVHLYNQWQMKIYGIQLYIHNKTLNKNIIVNGLLDDVFIDCLHNKYIQNIIIQLNKNKPSTIDTDTFHLYISSFLLKDFLINNKNVDYFNKYEEYNSEYKLIKQSNIPQTVKTFLENDLFNKRTTLLNLLIHSTNYENLYLAYLL